jgi:hypothetical protein
VFRSVRRCRNRSLNWSTYRASGNSWSTTPDNPAGLIVVRKEWRQQSGLQSASHPIQMPTVALA